MAPHAGRPESARSRVFVSAKSARDVPPAVDVVQAGITLADHEFGQSFAELLSEEILTPVQLSGSIRSRLFYSGRLYGIAVPIVHSSEVLSFRT